LILAPKSQRLPAFLGMAACFAACLAACLAGTACSRSQPADAAPPAAVKVEPPTDPDVFSVDKPEQFPLVAADLRRVHQDVAANGVVAVDVSRNVPVLSLSAGRVIEISARLGDEVKKGQLLLKIHSNDLALALSDYQKAVADELLARKARDRAKDLLDHGALAMKDLETADDAHQKAQVDLRTSAEHVRILGGDPEHPSPVFEVRAPSSGVIVEQNIQTAGGVRSLDVSPNLFTIADLSTVWILCDVYENLLSEVRLGDMAEVHLNAYPGRTWKARVSNISSLLDASTRTAKVRLELANPGGVLRPGMFAEARFTSQTSQDRVVIPATAILRLHDKDWVFRPLGGNQFRRVEIQGGEVTTDGLEYVLTGLNKGDQAVKNALQFATAIEK
jgi:cobalt-zinc-cadmium efflux system membrane fusion protein